MDDIVLLGAVGFVVNAATTFQDVAIDGLAVDIMAEEERARASGMMFGGQSIGMAIATAASGAAIVAYGPAAAYLLSGLFIAVVTLFVIAVRERPGERLLPWSSGTASAINLAVQAPRWWPILTRTFRAILRPASLLYVVVLLVKGAQYGAMTAATPLIATGAGGWSEAQVTAAVGTAQLVGGIAGMTIGGLLGDRLGAKWASVLFMACWIALHLAMLLSQPLWADGGFLTAFVIGWLTLDVLITVGLLPIAMGLSDRTIAATQFTLYMAASNFGISGGAALLGLSDRFGGIAPLFALLAIANLVAIAIMLTARFSIRRTDPVVADQSPQGGGLVPAIN